MKITSKEGFVIHVADDKRAYCSVAECPHFPDMNNIDRDDKCKLFGEILIDPNITTFKPLTRRTGKCVSYFGLGPEYKRYEFRLGDTVNKRITSDEIDGLVCEDNIVGEFEVVINNSGDDRGAVMVLCKNRPKNSKELGVVWTRIVDLGFDIRT